MTRHFMGFQVGPIPTPIATEGTFKWFLVQMFSNVSHHVMIVIRMICTGPANVIERLIMSRHEFTGSTMIDQHVGILSQYMITVDTINI
jgi:hypothetical protein